MRAANQELFHRTHSFLKTSASGILPFAVFAVLLLLVAPTFAEYGFQLWTVDNGLPESEVRGVTQTQDGYLWIATMNGLVRFDGSRFTVFNRTNSPGILSNRITALEQTASGDLWAVYERGGILRYHEGRFRSYDASDGIPGDNVSTVTSDELGNVWLLSSGKIAQWNSQTDRFILSTALNKRVYGPLVWDSNGFVAYDTNNVYCFSKGRFETYWLPERLRGKRILRVGLTQGLIAWLGMNSGEVLRLAPGDVSDSRELRKQMRYRFDSSEGQSWNIDVSADLLRSVSTLSAGKRRSISFRSAYPDRQGNLWLSTEAGLYRIREQVISAYSTEQGLLDRDVYPIFQDHAGSIWIGAWHKGLSRFVDGRFDNFTVADGLPLSLMSSIYQTKDGRIWIATHGGLATYEHNRFSTSGVPRLPGDVVQAMYQDRTGAIWFGTRLGVSTLDRNSLQRFPAGDDNVPRDVHVITQTPDGDLWFGAENGLTELRNGQVTRWSVLNGLGSNSVWSLLADPDGTLWIGTFDGGLTRLRHRQITRYTTANGLFDDGVFQILDDGLGNLWISCGRGIYRVSKSELNAFAEHRRNSISSIPYGKADGLLTLEFNGGVSPAGTKVADGTLWFPSRDGIAVVNPKKVRVDSHVPRVVIESASLDGVQMPLDTRIDIPPSKYNLNIQYTAPDLVRPDQLRFRYKLEGLDQDWIDVGSHRSASYTHLPAGRYRFIVAAASYGSTWSLPSEPLAINVVAPFYRQRWFEALLLTGLCLSAFAVWRYRVAELEAKHALRLTFLQQLITSQEDERKRIAQELHDSLGQRLVVLNSTAKLASRFMGDSSRTVESIFADISSEAAAGLEETRSIAYDLRPSHLDRLGLTQSIQYLVEKMAAASNILITAELDYIDDLVPAEQWINLYRIVQEALANVVKYSCASESRVRVDRSGQTAVLTIEDDGVGFDVDRNSDKSGRLGMGLRGMAERATLLRSNLQVWSSPGRGTRITVAVKKFTDSV